MGAVIGVVALMLVVVIGYALRSASTRGTTTVAGWGPRRDAMRRGLAEQARRRDGLAAREALATYRADAPPATRPLGIVFGDGDGNGVLVDSVTAGTAAARIGVPAGARITTIGGTAVTDRASAEAAVADARGGIPLTLTWRNGDGERSDSVIL